MNINEDLLHRIIISEINQNVRFCPTKINVFNTFNKLNKSCFKGSLPLCSINMITNKKYLGYFNYSGINKNGILNPTISINANYQYTVKEFESIVAHEMIHYYLAYNGIDTKCTHGNGFHSMASKINSAMGLNISDTVDVSKMAYNKKGVQISPQLLAYMNSYANSLKQYLPKLKQLTKNKNGGNITNFFSQLYSFTYNLVKALNIAVKKRSLNEASGNNLGNDGQGENLLQRGLTYAGKGLGRMTNNAINGVVNKVVPYPELQALINGARNGYKAGNNFLNGQHNGQEEQVVQYGNTQMNGNNAQMNGGLTNLLYSVYPNIKTQYQTITSNYNPQSLNSFSLVITNEFKIIDDLIAKINAEINAQGNTP